MARAGLAGAITGSTGANEDIINNILISTFSNNVVKNVKKILKKMESSYLKIKESLNKRIFVERGTTEIEMVLSLSSIPV